MRTLADTTRLLGGLLVFINPLGAALAGLIVAVQLLVDSLLLLVTILVNGLLTSLAVALLGL